MKRTALLLIAVAASFVFVEAQTEKLDYATIGRIRDEGLTRSQVMDHVSWLSDVYTTYSDQDFRLGLNAAQTSLGAVAELAGARLKK